MGLQFTAALQQCLTAAWARGVPQPFAITGWMRNNSTSTAAVASHGDISEETSFNSLESVDASHSYAISFAPFTQTDGGAIPAVGATFVAALFGPTSIVLDIGGTRTTHAWSPSGSVAFDVVAIGRSVSSTYFDYLNAILEHVALYDALPSEAQLDALRGLTIAPSDIPGCRSWHPFKGSLVDLIGDFTWTPQNLDTPTYVDLGIEYAVGLSVTYNRNGATGGAVPIDASSPYDEGDTVVVLSNTGSLVRPGYTFGGWNTAADGSGTARAPSTAFAMPASSVVLYAQWIKSAYVINHEDVDASILSNAQVAAAAALKVYFEHASTGDDIVGNTDSIATGLNNDSTQDAGLHLLYDVNNRYTTGKDHGESAYDASWFSTHNGLQDNMRGNPTPATKVSGFVSSLGTMAAVVDVALYKYCWIDVWSDTTGYISDGAAAASSDISTVTGLETTYGIAIPLVTMPIERDQSFAARQAYNDALRTYCAANNHWLFDLADMECWDTTRHVDGNSREVAVSSYVVTDGGHLSTTGALRVANAWWVLLANIASPPVPPAPTSEGVRMISAYMPTQRVAALPGTGVEGIIYVVEPGNASWTWYGGAYHIYESRPVSIAHPRRLGDNPA